MSVGRNPSHSENTEAFGAPHTSYYGQMLFAHTAELIDRPTPIGNFRDEVKGNIGGFSTTSASVQALASMSDYSGDFPLAQQASIAAPPPWERT